MAEMTILAIWVIASIVGLLFLILNIWMIIDAARRQDGQFPAGSKGLWLALLVIGLLLGFGWIVALVYYFMVYRLGRPEAAAAAVSGDVPPATGFEDLASESPADPADFSESGSTEIPASPDEGKRKTNLAVIVGALLAFLVVAGLVGAAVFVFVLGDPEVDIVVEPVDPPTTTTPTVDPDLGEPVEPAPVALSTVFTFRDIFDPLIKPVPEETETTTPTVTPNGDPVDEDREHPEGTLVLEDIVPVDDGFEAVLVWNGQTYTLAPGDRIPDSPWQVQSVSATEAVMLYGDIRVTLAIGSRVVK